MPRPRRLSTRRAAASLTVWLALAASPAASAPTPPTTAEELVARTIAAQGGQESWDAVGSLVFHGTYSVFSTPQPFVLYRQRPNHYRFEYQLLDSAIVHGWDGERAWWINQSIQSPVPWATEPPVPTAQAITAEVEIGGPLLDHRARGHRLELTGEVDLDGQRLYELVVTLATGGIEKWYIDPQSSLPLTRLSKSADGFQVKDQRVDFYDYRQTAGGLLLPHRLEIELGYNFFVMEIERAEIDVDLDDSLFAMPIPAGMDRLRGLEGRWRVHYESRPNPGVPWVESGDVETEIHALHQGALLEEQIRYPMFATPRRLKRWRSWDRFRELYQITLFDSMTGHVSVLEGRFEEDRLVASNVATGTPWQARGQTFHTREITYDLQPDSFKVDLESSADGGATWTRIVGFVYSRSPLPVPEKDP